jgi:type I restriction enzyme, S subunit
MKSNYKRLGDYIREVNNRNTELRVTNLLGINIDKFFMPSVANVVGTDMTTYKIVKMGQFACNRMHVGRDQRLPVALSRDPNDFLVSPAYNVFEVIDPNTLLPEYLMMWFSRREFDRNAWFYTDADVRGGLNWKDFCNMELPVPDIAKQREIVKEYNVLVNCIALNNQLIQKLEETAQAIYKQWFVDFEFPDENGKPYKSNGGEMIESELGDIPKNWTIINMKSYGNVITGKTPSSQNPKLFGDEMPFVTPSDFKNYGKYILGSERSLSYEGTNNLKNKVLKTNSIVVTCIGSDMGKIVINREECITNQQINSILVSQDYYTNYLYYYLKSISTELKSMAMGGSTMPMINKTDFELIKALKPSDVLLKEFDRFLYPVNNVIWNKAKIIRSSLILRDLLRSKLATIED